jgi:predicted HTH transcriptional regulator
MRDVERFELAIEQAEVLFGDKPTLGMPYSSSSILSSRADRPTRDAIASALSGLANSAGGGVLLLGVDPGQIEVPGVPDDRSFWSSISGIVEDMEPEIDGRFKTLQIGDVQVVAVGVEPIGPAGPCYDQLRGKSDGCFRVQGGEIRQWQPAVQKGVVGQDTEPVRQTSVRSLDDVLVRQLLRTSGIRCPGQGALTHPQLEKLHELGVLEHPTSHAAVTVAGLVALGRSPSQHLPGAAALLTRVQSDRERLLSAPAPRLVASLTLALTASGRFDPAAVEELLVNAVVHREYGGAARQAPIAVVVTPDRLVVANPGTLSRRGPAGHSPSPNPTLAGLAGRLGLCRGRGRGLRALKKRLSDRLETESRGTETRITLLAQRRASTSSSRPDARRTRHTPTRAGAAPGIGPAAAAHQAAPTAAASSDRTSASERKAAVLDLFETRAELTTAEITEALGWARSTTRNAIAQLVTDGHLAPLADSPRSPKQAYRRV